MAGFSVKDKYSALLRVFASSRFRKNRRFLVPLILLLALAVPSARARGQGGALLLGIENTSGPRLVSLSFATDAPVEPKVFTLENPYRLVIDLPGVARSPELDTWATATFQPAGDPDLLGVRLGEPATGTIRVVLDLARMSPYEVKPLEAGPGFTISILRLVEESTVAREAFPGAILTSFVRNMPYGPLTYHTLSFDPADKRVKIELELGQGMFLARETLSSMAARTGAAAAVNAGYFDMKTGSPVDMLIRNGEIYTLQERNRAFLGFTAGARPVFVKPKTVLSVRTAGGRVFPVNKLNRRPVNGEMNVFTPRFGTTTGTDISRVEISVHKGRAEAVSTGDSPIPQDGFIISADSIQHADFIAAIAPGDEIELVTETDPDISAIQCGVTAGPMIVESGQPIYQTAEEFDPNSIIVARRNPRTAACVTSGHRLLFAAVEGRSLYSTGVSLSELADLMQSFGCVDAINLDGGGSTEIIAGGDIVNALSDGRERPLGNAFMIYFSEN